MLNKLSTPKKTRIIHIKEYESFLKMMPEGVA